MLDREQVIRETILDSAQKNKQILHGSRAFNYQIPTYLKKPTKDYDIYSKSPKKYAVELANELKRRLGEEVNVSKGSHKGTFRVGINGEFIADITQLKHKPQTKKVWGIEVKNLKSIKKNAQRLIKDKTKEYRREKDLDTLRRIEINEETFNF